MSTTELIEKPKIDVPPGWPPEDEGGGGGGGGDGDGEGSPGGGDAGLSLGRMGTVIVMLSVTMIFLSFLSTYVLMRLESERWPPPEAPRLPARMWTSTLIIALSSIAATLATRAVARDRLPSFLSWTALTFGLGLVFCALQADIWVELVEQGLHLGGSDYAQNFFTLTALHVAHVIGGLVYLAVCLVRGIVGRIDAARRDAVDNCMLYWHFVGGIWLVLFLVLYFF